MSEGIKHREQRRNVLIQARMRRDGAWADVRIRNISSRGLLIQSDTPPPRGTYVEIFRARHTIVARVVWSKDRQFGIQTQDRLDVGAIIADPAQTPSAPIAPSKDRRADPRQLTAAHVAERLERSRRISAVLEFGCIFACGVAAAVITMAAVYETLSQPLEKVSSSLLQG